MSKLDPRIEVIREKYDLSSSDFWELPQKKGTWVCKHSALEIVAVKANITFDLPQIIESDSANGIAVLAVRGYFPSTDNGLPSHNSERKTYPGRSEWSTGEASPKNNKNAYPWAMAEKRAKDRVVLKLSGIAGLVYSEDEADDFKEPPSKAPSAPAEKPVQPHMTYEAYLGAITKATAEPELRTVFKSAWRDETLKQADRDDLKVAYEAKKAQLSVPDGYVAPTFEEPTNG